MSPKHYRDQLQSAINNIEDFMQSLNVQKAKLQQGYVAQNQQQQPTVTVPIPGGTLPQQQLQSALDQTGDVLAGVPRVSQTGQIIRPNQPGYDLSTEDTRTQQAVQNIDRVPIDTLRGYHPLMAKYAHDPASQRAIQQAFIQKYGRLPA